MHVCRLTTNNPPKVKCNYQVKKMHPVFRAYHISPLGALLPPTLLLLCQIVAVLSPGTGAEPAAVPAAAQSSRLTLERRSHWAARALGSGRGSRGREGSPSSLHELFSSSRGKSPTPSNRSKLTEIH